VLQFSFDVHYCGSVYFGPVSVREFYVFRSNSGTALVDSQIRAVELCPQGTDEMSKREAFTSPKDARELRRELGFLDLFRINGRFRKPGRICWRHTPLRDILRARYSNWFPVIVDLRQ